jgi:serine/threonine-protein kinase RsbW
MNPHREAKTIKLTIDSRLENIGLLGLAVQTLCADLGLSKVEAYQIQVCVVEAVTNVVKHAYRGQPGHEASVVATLHPQRISFQVLDTGETMQSLSRDPMEFDPADLATLPEKGMGLYIIQTVMDEVDYQTADGINILTMTKYLSRD